MTESDDAVVVNDRYRLERRVGRGGMADVFAARDLLLNRQVAVKILFPEFAVDPNFVERFRREAQAAANLTHPNIVNVYDWGRQDGTYFIAMEYVEGRTLGEILRANHRLDADQAADIAGEVAAAMAFAHSAGLVHRDIKPANILIGSGGQVKVADFGIARALNSATESNLTQAGAVMGTAAYFSPEQAQGGQPDPRSDLYSLGIVMYEMVAGKPPFSGDNPVSIAYKQVHDAPEPLRNLVPDIPLGYEAIVAKLLAKDPAVRYADGQALRDDLWRFRSGDEVVALRGLRGRDDAPTTVTSTPTGSPTAAATRVQPTAPRPFPEPSGLATTTSVAYQAPADMAQYPPGASPDAGYADSESNRTGWYALAAFAALIALIVGGVLLFQALSGGSDDGVGIILDDYTNQPLEAVTTSLDELGLPYDAIAEENPLVAENFVFRTVPGGGTLVFEGTVITLFYNPTAQLVPVPTVRGLTLSEAQRVLAAAGFQVNPITEESDLPEGTVIRTDPEEGRLVPQDTVITIVVSAGISQVVIPQSVIGGTADAARALLESPEYGLRVETRNQSDPSVPAGLVISTEPGPTTFVDRGSTVILVVSSGPEMVDVPSLEGLTETQALNRIQNAGLQPNRQTTDLPPGDAMNGRVVSQDPAAGSSIQRGSTITFVVGVAQQPTTTVAPTTTTAAPTTTTTTTTVPPTTAPDTPAPPEPED